MLTIPKLQKYLRQIIKEAIDPEELQGLEQKYQNDIIEKGIYNAIHTRNEKYSPKGWNFLNHAIEKLTELDDPQIHPQIKSDPQYKYKKIQDILTNELQFKKIGSGAFRDVYGKPDAPFIIKLEQSHWNDYVQKMTSSGTNKTEYDTYFNYGSDFQPRNELFPKIYAYDKTHGMWIIFEKVNTFNNSMSVKSQGDPNIIKIFQPCYNLLSQIFDFIENDPTLQKINVKTNVGTHNPFKIQSLIKDAFNDPITQSMSLCNIIFSGIILSTVGKITHYGDINAAFEAALLDMLVFGCLSYSGYNFKEECPREFNIFARKLRENFHNLKPTSDVAYLVNFLKNQYIEDLHMGNIGYRDMKKNPNAPWKNFVILDFGEYGGNAQNSSGFNPIQNMPSPKVPSNQSGQGGWTF